MGPARQGREWETGVQRASNRQGKAVRGGAGPQAAPGEGGGEVATSFPAPSFAARGRTRGELRTFQGL